MNTITQLGFITSKINELETAVFHSLSNSVLNLNPTVIKHLKIDDDGYIWFLVNKPVQKVTEFEKQFPAALNYYKKGTSFFLNVFGIARIIIDPEELACVSIDNEIENDIFGNKILLSVKITNVTYYEKDSANKRWLSKIRKTWAKLFVPEEDFYYPFENERHFA
jgi:general stress protein 26